jgi:hypothetical protein
MHSTNYTDTFISVAEDCPAKVGSIPPLKEHRTIARLQYEMISANPYLLTSDEVIFAIHSERNQVAPAEMEARRTDFFSRGQACLRSSPLGKRYGWGIHHDAESRVALYPRESEAYSRLSQDPALKQVKAMKSCR